MKSGSNIYLHLFPILLMLSAFSCHKSRPNQSARSFVQNEATEPIVFYTSLSDSLSQKAMDALELGDVTGIKVKYLNGHESRYFEYFAEKKLLIRTISQLPFTKYSNLSDTHCRRIDYENLMQNKHTISSTEYNNSLSFWNADPQNMEVYECIKSPFKHTLLIDPKTNHIVHRIELVG